MLLFHKLYEFNDLRHVQVLHDVYIDEIGMEINLQDKNQNQRVKGGGELRVDKKFFSGLLAGW